MSRLVLIVLLAGCASQPSGSIDRMEREAERQRRVAVCMDAFEDSSLRRKTRGGDIVIDYKGGTLTCPGAMRQSKGSLFCG